MTFDVESVTVQPEQCHKEMDEIQKRKQSLPARQTTWQQCPETVIFCDISSPMQASACRRPVPRATLCKEDDGVDPGTARCADRANTGKITETEEELECPNEMDQW